MPMKARHDNMDVQVRLFATFREAVGEDTLDREVPDDASVGDLLRPLAAEHPDLDLFEDGSLRGYVTVLQNGENVGHDEGLDTPLSDGDTISVFPPVSGG